MSVNVGKSFIASSPEHSSMRADGSTKSSSSLPLLERKLFLNFDRNQISEKYFRVIGFRFSIRFVLMKYCNDGGKN